MMDGRGALLAVFVAAAPFAGGEALADRLQDAVRDTLRKHPEVQAAAASVRVTAQGYEQASAGQLPTVDLRLGAGPEESENATTRFLGTGNRQLTRKEASLLLRQNLFDASQVRSQMDSQSALVDSSRARLGDAAESVSVRVVEAYLNSFRDDKLLALARDNVQVHEATLEKVRLRFSSGVGQRADLEQAEARLALARSNLVDAQGSERDSAVRFQRLVGRPPISLAAPELSARAIPGSLEEATRLARDSAYGIKAAQGDLNAARATVRAVRADLAPRLDAELSVNRNRDLSGVPGPSNDTAAMLVMRYNLFRGGADYARVREAAERETVALETLKNAQQSTDEEVARAWYAMVAGSDRLAYLEGHARATAQVLSAYQSQFELGRRTLLDVLNAANELYQARSAQVSGIEAFQLSQYRLLAAMDMLIGALGLNEELTKLDTSAPRE